MPSLSPSLDELVDALKRLPGLGPRSASRIAEHLLSEDRTRAVKLLASLERAVKTVKHCELCNTLTDEAVCPICADQTRDRTKICVVESPADQRVIEETMAYRGLYYVLMGLVSPVKGIGAEELHLTKLLERVKNDAAVREVLIATPFTPFIAKAMASVAPAVRVTRLARGIPAGVELEYTDANTIAGAIFGRK